MKVKSRLVYFLFLCFLISFISSIKSKNKICKNKSGQVKLTSNSIVEGAFIKDKYTPQGADIIPSFSWSDFPLETKSFAFVVEDPDAPRGTWYHWLVKNIPKDVNYFAENTIPGDQVINSWKQLNYKGPSPPENQTHRYYFKLYCLSVEKIYANDIESFLREIDLYKIDEASIMGKYKKTRRL